MVDVGRAEQAPAVAEDPETYKLFVSTGEPIEKAAGDSVIPIQEVVLRLPNDPVLVNGSPYDFRVDTEALAAAINYVRDERYSVQPGTYDPRLLSISFSDSLHPKVTGETAPAEKSVHDFRRNSLDITIPRENVDLGQSEEEIVAKIVVALNLELSQGLKENRAHKHQILWAKTKAWGGVAVLAAVGEGVGVEAGSSTAGMVLIGGGGLAVGALTGAVLYGVKGVFDRDLRKTKFWRDEVAAKKARKKVIRDASHGPYKHDQLDFSDKPVITLVPIDEVESRS